ncbi:MAG TPA: hypothetical protein DCS43_10630 [Verrucomicrobia bacterium]|nr:hypothetical protein [Verrucomicrobiota bacterium]
MKYNGVILKKFTVMNNEIAKLKGLGHLTTGRLQLTARLKGIAELDLVDLNQANSILAFEALCGLRMVVRDPDAVAAFSSLVARQYESDMLHAGHGIGENCIFTKP